MKMHGCQISTKPHSKFVWFNIWLYVQPLKAIHEYPLRNFVLLCLFCVLHGLTWNHEVLLGFPTLPIYIPLNINKTLAMVINRQHIMNVWFTKILQIFLVSTFYMCVSLALNNWAPYFIEQIKVLKHVCVHLYSRIMNQALWFFHLT